MTGPRPWRRRSKFPRLAPSCSVSPKLFSTDTPEAGESALDLQAFPHHLLPHSKRHKSRKTTMTSACHTQISAKVNSVPKKCGPGKARSREGAEVRVWGEAVQGRSLPGATASLEEKRISHTAVSQRQSSSKKTNSGPGLRAVATLPFGSQKPTHYASCWAYVGLYMVCRCMHVFSRPAVCLLHTLPERSVIFLFAEPIHRPPLFRLCFFRCMPFFVGWAYVKGKVGLTKGWTERGSRVVS